MELFTTFVSRDRIIVVDLMTTCMKRVVKHRLDNKKNIFEIIIKVF